MPYAKKTERRNLISLGKNALYLGTWVEKWNEIHVHRPKKPRNVFPRQEKNFWVAPLFVRNATFWIH